LVPSFGDRKIIVFGNNNSTFNEFDPHDLFHDRLSLVISKKQSKRPVDEGCAYLTVEVGVYGKKYLKHLKNKLQVINTNGLK
jgi:hypothetical protein